jgi:hypothetical protein
MTASVKVFGCRPRRTMPQTVAAGVRKPPREETAIWGRWPGRVGPLPQPRGFERWAEAQKSSVKKERKRARYT